MVIQVFELLRMAPQSAREKARSSVNMSEYEARRIETMNALEGSLTGYDCPKCKNKGVIYALSGGCEVSRPCECMEVRKNLDRIKKSGLQGLLDTYTFENYRADEDWQKAIKADALDFLDHHDHQWFFAGGQVGAGKTHICTAIAGEFLRRGTPVRYMLWKDESARLKAVVNDEEYWTLINPLKTVEVLYIDDIFKTVEESGRKRPPTPADVGVAFEILNYRYNNNCITILSSERTIEEILDCDEAVGSRIYQRTKDHCWSIGKDPQKNYRMR